MKGFPKRAFWKRKVPGKQNNYELWWQQTLEEKPNVFKVYYEAVKLKLADNTFYTPDFMVLLDDGSIEFHEVKGSWKAPNQEDARVKIKVAAAIHPWAKFVSVELKKRGGTFEAKFEEF
jgi:hypothetical protein